MSLLRLYKEHCFLVSTICTWSLVLTCHQGILERLDAGEVIIGDGSYVNTLEKRGYVKVEILSRASIVVDAAATNTLTARGYTLCVAKAGNYTPESSVEHPQAVEQLAQE